MMQGLRFSLHSEDGGSTVHGVLTQKTSIWSLRPVLQMFCNKKTTFSHF